MDYPQKYTEDLRTAQNNMFCRAFDADYRRTLNKNKMALVILETIELMYTPVNELTKLNKKIK